MLQKLFRFFVVFCIVLPYFPSAPAAAQTGSGLFNMLVIAPGVTRAIDIRQQRLFPRGCPQFFVIALGSGTLGISVRKDDVDGDTIFMIGAALSSAGTAPIYRIGLSKGMIDQVVEIGSPEQPCGCVWLYCGVALSQNLPSYNCQVRFSLTQ